MSVPPFRFFVDPLLRVLAEHPEGLRKMDAHAAVVERLRLAPEEREEQLKSGELATVNRVGWAHDRLKRALLSEGPSKGFWRVTQHGIAFAQARPSLSDVELANITRVAPVDDDEDIGPADDDDGIEGNEQSTTVWKDYPLDALSIRDERRTATDVVRRIEKEQFILDPDFQRDFVWSVDKQSRLIESILMRIPLPVFYVAEDAAGRLIVVDGRQRLTTLKRFFAGDLKLALPGREQFNGKHFEDLEQRLKNRVEDCQLLFFIIDSKVPEQARLDIFDRVNGGEVLTRQQMRNALHNGPATTMLREESASTLFIEATGGSLSAKKMSDREFVNRFLSLVLLERDSYRGDMDDWLSRGLKALNQSPAELPRVTSLLRLSLQNNLTVFGKHAFRRHNPNDDHRSMINAALFDVMSVGLSRYSAEQVTMRQDALRLAFYGLLADESFIKALTRGPNSKEAVRDRFRLADAMFDEVFRAPTA